MGFSDLGDRAIVGRIVLALEETQPPAWVNDIAMRVSSDVETETYRWLASTPAMRQWDGPRHATRLEVFEQTIRNVPYEASLELMRSELRRDKTGQIQLRINDLAIRAQQHWAKLLSTVIEAGNATASYDGSNFFHTAHSSGSSGDQNNDLTSNFALHLAPTAAEMEGAIIDCIEALLGFNDTEGEPMNQDMSNLLIMCPTSMFSAANAAISNATITDGSGARTNVLAGIAGFSLNLVVNPRLANDGRFYVFRTDSAVKPYIAQEETMPTVEVLGEGSDFAFANDAHQYGVHVSHAVGQAIWQHAVLYTAT